MKMNRDAVIQALEASVRARQGVRVSKENLAIFATLDSIVGLLSAIAVHIGALDDREDGNKEGETDED